MRFVKAFQNSSLKCWFYDEKKLLIFVLKKNRL